MNADSKDTCSNRSRVYPSPLGVGGERSENRAQAAILHHGHRGRTSLPDGLNVSLHNGERTARLADGATMFDEELGRRLDDVLSGLLSGSD